MNARVIIIDQEPFSNRLAMFLTETDDQIVIAGRFCSAADASAFLERKSADLILWHLSAENFSALRVLRNTGCTAAVILLMHRINPDLMAQAIALGVSDCILMPCDPARLRHSIQNFLERERILRSDGELNQGMIDHLLHHPLPSESGVRLLPKGLSQRTLSMLEQLIRSHPNDAHTCESLSVVSGLSKVTVRNYLNYLMEAGRLTCSTDYETGGRPRVLYRIL